MNLRERKESSLPPKKEYLLIQQSIVEVATKPCCQNNCMQHFPHYEIVALGYQLHVKGGVYVHKLCLLEAHKQSQKDAAGKEWITLKSRDVCLTAWWTIHGISKATSYRFKHMSREEVETEDHGNMGLKKPRTQIVQATTTLRALIVDSRSSGQNVTQIKNFGFWEEGPRNGPPVRISLE